MKNKFNLKKAGSIFTQNRDSILLALVPRHDPKKVEWAAAEIGAMIDKRKDLQDLPHGTIVLALQYLTDVTGALMVDSE